MKRKMIWAIVVGIPVFFVVLLAVRSALTPAPTNLGATDGKLAACPDKPNCVSSQAEDEAHRIEPFSYEGDGEAALARIKSAMEEMPRTRVVAEEAGYLRAEATSLIFRFVDDVEFLLDAEAGVIHVRSASRTGYSDMGVNRKRVEAIRAAVAG